MILMDRQLNYDCFRVYRELILYPHLQILVAISDFESPSVNQ